MAKTPQPQIHQIAFGAITVPILATAIVCAVLYLSALGLSAPEPIIDLLRGGMLVGVSTAVLSAMHAAEARDLRAAVRVARAEVEEARKEGYAHGYTRGFITGRRGRPMATPEEIEAMRPALRAVQRIE